MVSTSTDEWAAVEAATGWSIPAWVRSGCVAPKVVTIPAGRELYAAGPSNKERMEWGAFEENDISWYLQGNQLDPIWYTAKRTDRTALYEYCIVVLAPTVAVMSKVASQSGAPLRKEPSKFQFYSPLGFGKPTRGRLLGYLEVDGSFTPSSDAATVFNDPLYVDLYDPDHSSEEHRYLIIGMSQEGRLLIVSYTERDNVVRLISAREVTSTERIAYEED